MNQPGLFDLQERLDKIDKNGDPLLKLNEAINWELFRPMLETIRNQNRTSNAGAHGYDAILLFKTLILQSLYNLSDENLEFQILDRLSFMRFLNLHLGSKVPDHSTVWRFRESLAKAELVEKLFDLFDEHLRANGFVAMKGQIVDASVVRVPIQRNTSEENIQIKKGEVPDWPENKRRRKDVDARWGKKGKKSFFGYKNHLSVDVKHKLIRRYAVTDASVHDSNIFRQIFTDNTSKDIWADSAYRSGKKLKDLATDGFREHIQRKGTPTRKLTQRELAGNRTRARVRSRVEHIFGIQKQKAGDLILRTVGIVRARAKIGLRNLAYNMDRVGMFMLRSKS